MFAEIITIGDEILIGQIVDTNSAFISKELNKIGVSVYQITSVQDDREHILQALEEAKGRAQVVIMTGGLGPTKDDITKHTLCEFFNDTLVEDAGVLAHVEELFEKYISSTPISDMNRMQALVPSKATVLHNALGTAPGMWFKDEGVAFVSLPGVPYEMENLIVNQVIPKIIKDFERPYILHKTIVTYGLGESAIAERLEQWEDHLPPFVKLAYLPNLGKVRLRLSAKGPDKQVLVDAVEKEAQKLPALIGDIMYGTEDEETLEELVAKTLTGKGLTLATAESFTGGKIAGQLTALPGASAYFKGSVVSYASDTKINVLKVPKDVVDRYSVVSAEVAEAMAKNVRSLLKTDYAIATTGNAGPTKGDSDAEVGTVFLAIATPTGVHAQKFNMGNHRNRIVEKSVNKALELLQKEISKI
ncbi:competence/damage-inducible protein A [Zobellia galactanivorans]|uniref:competence/damage-inducible protein A n=1 Tax=Zobellia galactanivorans (strain DSM 12802 / CCUG 47099 / CIP 106680 / NCIMB 13871 / Dsij) TaxID=63186 RepID=UPI001C07115C|nr:competence/damage-inducible protein A [Zobellia galactanivorans]MBU3026897.1 competence/damage-inducible protein A [Zobellia galactanivorans]